MAKVAVIIPALNEELAIGKVIEDIPTKQFSHLHWQIIVVDNGSTDRTAEVAQTHGAQVVKEKERGYGAACLKGLSLLDPSTDIVVFLDGDYADDPREMGLLLEPILEDKADFVLGSRTKGRQERFALNIVQRFGNFVATRLIYFFWRVRYSDLGPFRAIRYEALRKLRMQDRNFGWTVEMQIKAAQQGLRILEVPVSYRRRIGKSKISGTLRGIFLAGYTILKVIFTMAIKTKKTSACK
ncbi:MAG: glycosyltransferase family 2 protein [Leptospiraceae bacterium]|nr:glycosyltransferase family 2 protein [Leptospiraceae bacterium]MDW8305792.1 glycosyltransferase family 2 protein [Leptospiraceae bacterium]